jgi:hypothetical protein
MGYCTLESNQHDKVFIFLKDSTVNIAQGDLAPSDHTA